MDEPQRPKPARPEPDKKVSRRTDRWMKDTGNAPAFDQAVKAWREAQKTLFPARNDPSDPFRGQIPLENRRRKDDRKVRIPLAYRNVMQTVAMTVPDDHGVRWRAREMVPAMNAMSKPIGRDPFLTTFGTTVRLVSERHLEEIAFQEIAEACVQDSTQFPLAVLKVSYQRDFHNDPIKSQAENHDEQDNFARLQHLREMAAQGDIRDDDPEWEEMSTLQEGMFGTSEITLWQGLSVENLPLNAFGFDPNVSSIETIYSAAWMKHDVIMAEEEILTKFAYKVLQADADGKALKWEGVHPDDLKQANGYDSAGKELKEDKKKRIKGSSIATDAGDGTGSDDGDSPRNRYHLVREVWAKSENKVLTFVAGVPYPAKQVVPTKQPEQWYPFVVLVLNRVFGEVYGISDVELQADIQHRINRKASDEEKARWLSLPRGIGNSQLANETERTKMSDIAPGSVKWVNLGTGQRMADAVEWMKYEYNPESFNKVEDYQFLRQMASLPEQATGVTGRAQFAAEVNAAMQGAAVSSTFRQGRVRRFLERFYTVVAEILLQELTKDDVTSMVGSNAIWPLVYKEQEGKRLFRTLLEEERQKATTALGQDAVMALSGAMTEADVAMIQQQLKEQADTMARDSVKERCRKAFGFDEPMTRETIYRRLQCKVYISMSGQMDRDQRVKNLMGLFEALGNAAAAAQQSGVGFNPLPFLRKISALLGEDDDLDEMFDPDPNMLVQNLIKSVQDAPDRLQPEAAAALVQLSEQIKPALMAAMAQQGPNGGQKPGAAQSPSAASTPSPQPQGNPNAQAEAPQAG